MVKTGLSVLFAITSCAVLALPARAQVRDAEYRGTLVCGKLPFAEDPTRASITIKIANNQGPYDRPVHMPVRSQVAGTETGNAKVNGNTITLTGGWSGEKSSYEASYSGTFVRRSAKLTGTQSWTHDGKTFTRNCSGAIKRPLAAFLPRQKKTAQ